ncbi:hypothetical protein [Granulicoccus phenolivorans]|uniref:hypothetical protein n=1 Tax=Granulicoccus phenolivorans TaxID=266854 RepID=UPI0003F99CA7|nr:hypothetical protein [Granulicoccus phenolivorans]
MSQPEYAEEPLRARPAPWDPEGPDPLAHLYAGPGAGPAERRGPTPAVPVPPTDPYADLPEPGVPAYLLPPGALPQQLPTSAPGSTDLVRPAAGVQPYRPEDREQHPLAERVAMLGWLSLGLSVTAPLAWYWGSRARADFRREPDRYDTTPVNLGWMLGVVQTIGLALALGLLGVIVLMS